MRFVSLPLNLLIIVRVRECSRSLPGFDIGMDRLVQSVFGHGGFSRLCRPYVAHKYNLTSTAH